MIVPEPGAKKIDLFRVTDSITRVFTEIATQNRHLDSNLESNTDACIPI